MREAENLHEHAGSPTTSPERDCSKADRCPIAAVVFSESVTLIAAHGHSIGSFHSVRDTATRCARFRGTYCSGTVQFWGGIAAAGETLSLANSLAKSGFCGNSATS